MPEKVVVRGDAYVIRRPVFILDLSEVVLDINDQEVIQPLDMSGCTIRSTFKTAPTNPATDPSDGTAALACSITFDENGAVTAADGFRLPDGKTAENGQLWLTATSAKTAALPLGVKLNSDVEVTDQNNEQITIFSSTTLSAVEGYTNRST